MDDGVLTARQTFNDNRSALLDVKASPSLMHGCPGVGGGVVQGRGYAEILTSRNLSKVAHSSGDDASLEF